MLDDTEVQMIRYPLVKWRRSCMQLSEVSWCGKCIKLLRLDYTAGRSVIWMVASTMPGSDYGVINEWV